MKMKQKTFKYKLRQGEKKGCLWLYCIYRYSVAARCNGIFDACAYLQVDDVINRDSDSPHRDFASPPLIIVEQETNTHCRPVLASPQHIKQMQEAGPQKTTWFHWNWNLLCLWLCMWRSAVLSFKQSTAIKVRFKGKITTNTMRYEQKLNLAPA